MNQYNRKRGTYGNGDGKDASHKGGKIVGFEKESKNRGRAEKSRLKKEAIFEDLNDAQLSSRIKHWAGQHKGTGVGYGHVLGSLAIHLKEMGWDKSFKEIVKVAKELSKKKKVESVFAVKGKEGKDGYRSPENPDFKYDPEKKESVNEELYNSQGEQTDFKNGDMVKDINPGCPHVGSEGEVTKVGTGTITFKVTNNGKTYQEGDELEKTVEQMVKLKESVNEGKWSKIMTSVRKGSKAGPLSIVVIKGKKVLHQRLVKILQQIPAHYEDVKKKYPRAFIAIEDKYGHRVYTESVNEAKANIYGVDFLEKMTDKKFKKSSLTMSSSQGLKAHKNMTMAIMKKAEKLRKQEGWAGYRITVNGQPYIAGHTTRFVKYPRPHINDSVNEACCDNCQEGKECCSVHEMNKMPLPKMVKLAYKVMN